MTPLQASALLVLHESRLFDTLDIAQLIGVHESEVARVIQASRDIRIEMARQDLTPVPHPPQGRAG